MLTPRGRAIVTTPNVDTLATRLRFALSGVLRAFEPGSDPQHITPVFHDLMVRQWLPRPGMRLVDYATYGEHGMRWHNRLGLRLARRLLPDRGAETHIFVLA